MNADRTEKSVAEDVASDLLKCGAVQLRPSQPFKWASGWNSPIYCDNRITLSFPDIRKKITGYLSEKIKSRFPQANLIAGVATAGIPQGALIAERLNLPFVYVRSKPKGHGMENLIEGKVKQGSRAVVIEDLISTGGSSLKAAGELQNAGVEVLGLGAIFTYGFKTAEDNFKNAGVPYFTLSNYEVLIEKATEEGIVEKADLDSLNKWRENPGNWNTV